MNAEMPSGQSVLIVDDTPANLEVLLEFMTEAGYDVSVATDGEKALERLKHVHPDLILLDVMMPGIDGFETCRRLKEKDATREIPVVFMTALSETVDKVRGFAVGARGGRAHYRRDNIELEEAVAQGDFREDLFYRLNVFPIRCPALRERREDIPLLVEHFVGKYGARMGKRIETVPQKVMEALREYDWPGNVRELENIVERAVIVSRGTGLELGDWLPKRTVIPGAGEILTLEEVERMHILEVLEQTRWRVRGDGGTAELLDIKPTTLEARMKKLGIERKG